MYRLLIIGLSVLLFNSNAWSQEQDEDGIGAFAFGAKGGFTLASQAWNKIQMTPIISYHGDLFVEWMGGWKTKAKGPKMRYGFQAQLGYHRKGSAWGRAFQNNITPNIFHNIGLAVLGKGYFQTGKFSPYYGIGLRMDYTVKSQLVTPQYIAAVRKITYGIWFGGGIEWHTGEKSPLDLVLEVSVSPDIGPQIEAPPVDASNSGMIDYLGNPVSLPAQKVFNIIFEVSLGVKLVPSRGVEYEYIDD
ncbi:MAG: hypothetical protein GY810_16955 [Aureispira sp.]|nr:hypothetical protein [Aureispira sp.]